MQMAFTEITIFLCIFLVAKLLVSAQLEVGDPCGPKGDRICTLDLDCPEAVAAIKARKPHGLEKCGWKGTGQILCCSRPSTGVIDRNPIRKSTSECMKYWEVTQVDYTTFIVGGYNATLGEFPHMAALGYDNDGGVLWGDCGGSLISTNFVLTAAHCLIRSDRKVPVMVRLGKIDLFGDEDGVPPQDIKVAQNIPHKEYKHFDKLNDIALIRLEKNAEFSANVKPICLYVEDTIPNNSGLVIAGWGKVNSTGAASRFLLQAMVKTVDLGACNQTFLTSPAKKPLFASHLCALSPDDFPSDTCQGDSGGPLQIINRKANKKSPLIIVGVTSFGRGCGGPTPSVYTRVSSYLDWIEATVWSN